MNLDLMRELSVKTDSKIVLLVLDGLGGLPDSSGQTELEAAETPNFDQLAALSDLGLSRPMGDQAGVSPGSGPGHLGLFGYDPIQFAVGRGVLKRPRRRLRARRERPRRPHQLRHQGRVRQDLRPPRRTYRLG